MRPRPSSRALALLCSLAFVSKAFAQGSLTPPGAPGPTMKRLDQVEARTLIPGGTTPFVISAPGSYYLAGNLQVAGATAITVNASNVTVDLNGFTIFSTASPAAGTAVLIASGGLNVTVRNGHIFGAGTVSATGAFSGGGFANGVFYDSSTASAPPSGLRAHDLTVTGCSGDGINLYSLVGVPSISSAERCVVRNVGNFGIFAATLRGCSAFSCGYAGILGNVASDCVATVLGGPGPGIQANTASNCSGNTTGSGVGLGAANATNCYGYSTAGIGLSATTGLSCQGQSDTGPQGVSSSYATNCYGILNGGTSTGAAGLSTSTAIGCAGVYNGSDSGDGLRCFGAASHCVGRSTNGRGLAAKTADGCTGLSNSSTGLSASDTASNCSGETASNLPALSANVAQNCQGTNMTTGNGVGLYALTALNCRGTTSGAGFGLQAVNSATSCFGTSNTGTGLRTPTATGCFGQTSSGTVAAPALFAVTATNCRGWQVTNTGVAIQADVAITCSSQAGTIVAGFKGLGTP